MQLNSLAFAALFVAADLGAGNIKLRSSRRSSCYFSMPSLICKVDRKQVEEGDRKIYNSDVFHINDEIFWFAGDSVLERRLSSENPGQDANLKIENAPYFLMSALVLGNYLQEGVLNKVGLVLSHHASDEMGAILRAKIEGEHTVSHKGKQYQMIFHLPEQGVYQEGSKIIAGNTQHGLLDLGYLTALYTRRSKTGAILGSNPTDAGVNRLVEMICNDSEFRTALGGIYPDRDRVVKSIFETSRRVEKGEKKTQMTYRNKGVAIDITSSYKRCLVDWLKQAARSAVNEINEEKGSEFSVAAIGGGVKLPGVVPILKKFGIDVYDQSDPIYANCDSLYRSVVRSAIKDQAFEGWFQKEDILGAEAEVLAHV